MPSPSKALVYPPIAVQMRRRRWIGASLVSIITVVFCTVLFDHLGGFGYRGDDYAHFDRKTIVVIDVTDACTVSIRTTDCGRVTTVRLLGTDNASGVTAADATAYTVARLRGKTATLRLDTLQPRDAAGNLLGYVYLSDTDTFNIDLVREGYAYSDRRANHLLRAVMDGAEFDARKHSRGMWHGLTETAMPEWRQQWLRDLREHHHVVE